MKYRLEIFFDSKFGLISFIEIHPQLTFAVSIGAIFLILNVI
jgi:hypothetical protein